MNDTRCQFAKNGSSVANLLSIHTALPSSAAMHQLISQSIETSKNNGQHSGRLVCVTERPIGCLVCPIELSPPFLLSDSSATVVPEWLKDELVVQEEPNRSRERVSDQRVEQFAVIE